MKSTTHIRLSERDKIIESVSADARRLIRRIEAQAKARVTSARRALEREKQRSRERAAKCRRDGQVLYARHKRARSTVDKRNVEIKELNRMLKLQTDLSESLVTVICDHIADGLSLRAACRMTHVRVQTVEKILADARAQGERASLFHQFTLAAIEEALGKNEKLWVDKAKNAMDDEVVALGEGATFKRGDGKLAMMMLERQHSKDYSPRHVVVAEDNRTDDDLSDLTDEELEVRRKYEAMVERRAKLGSGKAVAGFLAPPNNSTGPASIPVDAEIEDA